MSRTNFFTLLESDDEESAPVTRGGQTAAKKRGGQTAAFVEQDGSLPWGDTMTGMRAEVIVSIKPSVANLTELHKDFCDEPWKYGDEILNHWDSIVANPEMEEYWRNRDALAFKPLPNFSPIAKDCAKVCAKRWVERDIRKHVTRITNAIITIQKIVRGYQTRCNNPHLDCCMCLSHTISPLKTAAGYMCRDCAEMGPHEDIFPEDPMNWHRCDYVDEAPSNHESCAWCRGYVSSHWGTDYCSYECEWKDRTA